MQTQLSKEMIAGINNLLVQGIMDVLSMESLYKLPIR